MNKASRVIRYLSPLPLEVEANIWTWFSLISAFQFCICTLRRLRLDRCSEKWRRNCRCVCQHSTILIVDKWFYIQRCFSLFFLLEVSLRAKQFSAFSESWRLYRGNLCGQLLRHISLHCTDSINLSVRDIVLTCTKNKIQNSDSEKVTFKYS